METNSLHKRSPKSEAAFFSSSSELELLIGRWMLLVKRSKEACRVLGRFCVLKADVRNIIHTANIVPHIEDVLICSGLRPSLDKVSAMERDLFREPPRFLPGLRLLPRKLFRPRFAKYRSLLRPRFEKSRSRFEEYWSLLR
jgi:hypothetical protein